MTDPVLAAAELSVVAEELAKTSAKVGVYILRHRSFVVAGTCGIFFA